MQMDVELTLTEPMLGTKPDDPKVFESFVASKAPNDDKRKQELESMEHVERAGTTRFARDETGFKLFAYQIEGCLKDKGETLRQCNPKLGAEEGRRGKKWGAIKSKIDRFLCVYPIGKPYGRDIYLLDDKGKPKKAADGSCERPLRAETMQGPRVTLARSETVAAGTRLRFTIDVLDGSPISREMVKQMLDMGQRRGLGQWRNAGNGRFTWKELKSKKTKRK